MQWTISNKLYEALRTMQIRSECRTLPRGSANLWLGKVKPSTSKAESMLESSITLSTSKRQYGVEMEGNPVLYLDWMKSNCLLYESLWLLGYKPCSSIEGATSVKMTGQINKTSHPELGCSGDLNPTVTVHSVNVGTSCFGLMTGLAEVDVKHEGREIRSSLSQIGSGTRRRNLASCGLKGSRDVRNN